MYWKIAIALIGLQSNKYTYDVVKEIESSLYVVSMVTKILVMLCSFTLFLVPTRHISTRIKHMEFITVFPRSKI